MAIPRQDPSTFGEAQQRGGSIHIRFPHMQVEMSCDNEVELASCVEMLKKALELHEIELAKEALMPKAQVGVDPLRVILEGPTPPDIWNGLPISHTHPFGAK